MVMWGFRCASMTGYNNMGRCGHRRATTMGYYSITSQLLSESGGLGRGANSCAIHPYLPRNFLGIDSRRPPPPPHSCRGTGGLRSL